MNEYDAISAVYDAFTDGFDYENYIEKLFASAPFLPQNGLLLDCGCGTGTVMRLMSKCGYDCTGIDISPEMLSLAEEKLKADGITPHLVCQPLEEIDLYGAYDIVLCTLDTVNHLTEKRALKSFFKRIINFTEPGGYFIFDAKTEEEFLSSEGYNIAEKDGMFLSIHGDYNAKTGFMYYDITAFNKSADELYERCETYIEERFYDPNTLQNLALSAGFIYKKSIRFGKRKIYIYQKKNQPKSI